MAATLSGRGTSKWLRLSSSLRTDNPSFLTFSFLLVPTSPIRFPNGRFAVWRSSTPPLPQAGADFGFDAPSDHPASGQVWMGNFVASSTNAGMRDFRPLPLPGEEESYKDDVHIGCYKSADLAFDGKRRGTHESFRGCENMGDRILRALRELFPLAHATHLPANAGRGVYFPRDPEPHSDAAFSDKQLTRMDRLLSAFPAGKPDGVPVFSRIFRRQRGGFK